MKNGSCPWRGCQRTQWSLASNNRGLVHWQMQMYASPTNVRSTARFFASVQGLCSDTPRMIVEDALADGFIECLRNYLVALRHDDPCNIAFHISSPANPR
jgi:hypothetical protein